MELKSTAGLFVYGPEGLHLDAEAIQKLPTLEALELLMNGLREVWKLSPEPDSFAA